jgi:hypothetical protein
MLLMKTSIQIIPDTDQDEAYLEAILKLNNAGDKADAIRVSPMGLQYSWAYLEIRPRAKA